jgi:hypothetical protein
MIKALVLLPASVLLVAGLDVGGLQAPVSAVVVRSAEAVARPVSDELLERLPWPGPRRAQCVFGPYATGDPCSGAQLPT